MKKNLFFISLAVVALSFTSCSSNDNLTPNADYDKLATSESIQKENANNNGNNNGNDDDGSAVPFLASTMKSNRAALLEDFTGVRCGYCPDGHVKAEAAKALLGADNFIILAVHGGSYADPMAGWANFTTAFGSAMISQADVSGFAAGTVSRFPAKDLGVTPQKNGSAMSRSSWQNAGTAVNGMEAPLNIGAKAVIDDTDELTVNVDIYFTETVTGAAKINVALVQDGLISKQSSGGENYVQNNVLRHLITGQWGEVISEDMTEESKVRKTYTYSVPADYNGTSTEGGGAVVKSDLKVIVFVTENNTNVYNVIEIDVED